MAYIIDRNRCVGCGACAYECLFNVPKPVDENKKKYVIDRTECVGCGQCEVICPNGAIFPEPGQRKIRKVEIQPDLCIGCSLCRKACKAQAPHGELKSPFEIDQKKCFRCGVCASKCPKKAISLEYEEESVKKGALNMYRIYCKIFQAVMKVANYFLGYRMPEYIEGAGAVKRLPQMLKEKGAGKVLVVTDNGLMKLGLPEGMLAALKEEGVEYALYSDVSPNPTSDNVEAGFKIYQENNCQAIVAMGGGSPMDCAKGIGAKAAHPKKSVAQLQGILKVHKKIPLFFAVPTTAGTGSETTVAAVITDSATHHKASINDPSILPKYAVLDPELTLGLPPFITSTTGLDALAHAVEAYTNHKYNTPLENDLSKKAVRLIYDNLLKAYQDGSDIEARQNMQKAAFFAGRAFTRGCVGYVHAIGHTLGGLYGVAHGLAMSILLPHVMRAFGSAAHQRLAELADVCGMDGKNDAEKADKFISWIEEMKRQMNIPEYVDMIKDEDVEQIISWAMKEANPLYPTPVLWEHDDLSRFIASVRA
ncbi:MAG: iron-containing alcohol dehydrogenase [Parasporobacterium sp.]|nr:iron-containing alcohol dehydrogenase [Parasporobacterium sp.]